MPCTCTSHAPHQNKHCAREAVSGCVERPQEDANVAMGLFEKELRGPALGRRAGQEGLPRDPAHTCELEAEQGAASPGPRKRRPPLRAQRQCKRLKDCEPAAAQVACEPEAPQSCSEMNVGRGSLVNQS